MSSFCTCKILFQASPLLFTKPLCIKLSAIVTESPTDFKPALPTRPVDIKVFIALAAFSPVDADCV